MREAHERPTRRELLRGHTLTLYTYALKGLGRHFRNRNHGTVADRVGALCDGDRQHTGRRSGMRRWNDGGGEGVASLAKATI